MKAINTADLAAMTAFCKAMNLAEGRRQRKYDALQRTIDRRLAKIEAEYKADIASAELVYREGEGDSAEAENV